MIKVDIFSGFLGAGKTTLIKKLIEEAYKGEKVVLIENEFGEIGIDGGFLKDAGVEINEMNSGCICCSLVGDFGKALEKVIAEFHPDRILIEPSGVGKLSDIIQAVEDLDLEEVKLNGFTTIVDAKKVKIYMKNFGEFYNNQVEHASSIILSHTKGMEDEKIEKVVETLREHNPNATIITTDWDALSGTQILAAMEKRDTIEEALHHLEEEHEHNRSVYSLWLHQPEGEPDLYGGSGHGLYLPRVPGSGCEYTAGSGERGSIFRLSGFSQQPGGHTKEGAVNERENHPVRSEQMHGLLCLRHGLHG